MATPAKFRHKREKLEAPSRLMLSGCPERHEESVKSPDRATNGISRRILVDAAKDPSGLFADPDGAFNYTLRDPLGPVVF
ncbi:hypothetical protein NKR23_g4315 [Pleurostoma richardsiae]|uniref:Uncharacterized protein n=1 Tax=Pleurostoma richardsiae TaxID=41990 RepID=A0AA38RIF1_9PEZI|nr:hypothetical protein NKR23_g4315 [Pleurostoma richardsiae]